MDVESFHVGHREVYFSYPVFFLPQLTPTRPLFRPRHRRGRSKAPPSDCGLRWGVLERPHRCKGGVARVRGKRSELCRPASLCLFPPRFAFAFCFVFVATERGCVGRSLRCLPRSSPSHRCCCCFSPGAFAASAL